MLYSSLEFIGNKKPSIWCLNWWRREACQNTWSSIECHLKTKLKWWLEPVEGWFIYQKGRLFIMIWLHGTCWSAACSFLWFSDQLFTGQQKQHCENQVFFLGPLLGPHQWHFFFLFLNQWFWLGKIAWKGWQVNSQWNSCSLGSSWNAEGKSSNHQKWCLQLWCLHVGNSWGWQR